MRKIYAVKRLKIICPFLLDHNILPCHRIVAANGLGGFNAGIKVKRYLLEYEKCKSYPTSNFCKICNI